MTKTGGVDESPISELSPEKVSNDSKNDQNEKEILTKVESNIYSVPNLEDEKISEENWRNIQKGSRKRKSVYLTPNCEILLRNIDSRAKTKVIGLIKNGSRSNLMSVKFKNCNYVLSNTCAFDTIVQILAEAYCDSTLYAKYVKQKTDESTLWQLIFCLLRDGVTVQTYKKRVEILSNLYSGESMVNGIIYLSVEQSIDTMLNVLLKNYESVKIREKCSLCKFERSEKKSFLTLCVTEKIPTKIQLTSLINKEIKQLCTNTKCQFCYGTIEVTVIFEEHLFFNMINLNNTTDAIFTDTRIVLSHIPKYISTPQFEYSLRGLGTTPDYQQIATSYKTIGHYHAHAYRNPIDLWQMYDDTKEKVQTVNKNTKVNLQILMYSK